MRAHAPTRAGKEFDRDRIADLLFEGMRSLRLKLSQNQFDQLLDYLALLHKWNEVYNLTAVRAPDLMVYQHLLDSLAVVPAFVAAKRVLDVGSGGGLPGIVLAIAKPELEVDLIDAVQKKTAFLSQVKSEIGLVNATVHTGRVEKAIESKSYDTITSRAFSSLGDMINLTSHLLEPNGRYIAMKGAVPSSEMEDLPQGWKVSEIRKIDVPGLKAERHLVFIERNAS